jgi:hypothetical protein
MVRGTKQLSVRLVLTILLVQSNARQFHLYRPLLHIVQTYAFFHSSIHNPN